ncbi:hypothetical protein [Luteolibacter luteus]|uniref:Uncharacterized protein n=1 Tax=Luteolibacter luteus TaxID=2728835 RepID=A0A858RG35_9BACT|nr:hypothetical protein [Luteolibacter luteus]QJE95807.1 hypothetical protein HHL09_08405 [Luteolibacter luteus]
MKAVFYVLALLMTGGAAFFSFSNKGKFEDQKEIKESTIDLNKAKGKEIEDQQAKLDEEKVNLETANREREQVKQNIDSLVAKGRQLTRDLASENSRLEEQKATFAKLKEAQDKVTEMVKGAGAEAGEPITLETLPAAVQKLEEERQAKEKQVAELESNIEAAQKAVEKNQAEIGRLADRDASRDSRIRRNAMQSVVTAVNDDWGFVVIGAGSNTGFTPATKLVISRDGRRIGEVKPSSIEPSQTIAEIDPDTIAPGVRIQPGDTVILAEPATN